MLAPRKVKSKVLREIIELIGEPLPILAARCGLSAWDFYRAEDTDHVYTNEILGRIADYCDRDVANKMVVRRRLHQLVTDDAVQRAIQRARVRNR